MPEKTRKFLKYVRKCHRKSPTTMPFTQSFVQSKKKEKGHRTRRLPKVFFSLSAYFKTNETKKVFRYHCASFSASFGTSASSFEETVPDEEKMALHRTLQPNKNAVISKIKKRHLQLPKSSEKIP